MTTIPAGYKQTEVGVIPEEWEYSSIGRLVSDALIEKPLDGNHGAIHPKSSDYVAYGIPFIMANNVENGQVDFDGCVFITEARALRLQKGFSKTGDVLLTHKATIGHTAVVGTLGVPFIMLTPQVTYYRVRNSEKLLNQFLRYFFDGNLFQNAIKQLSDGGTRSYIGILAQHQLPFILPPLPEQKRIAQVLGDVDALIQKLETLIAKKRDIKQATMQDLLTGKKRLPGFSGPWETKKLGEVGICLDNFRIPLNDSQRNTMKGDIPYCGANGVVGYVNNYTIDDSVILLAEDGGYFDEFRTRPIAYKMSGKLWINNHAHIIKAVDWVCQDFLFFSLVHKDIREYITSGTRSKLNKSELRKIDINLPLSKSEQSTIAQVLSDMDSELSRLETRLAKARDIKAGLMQELLTGRIRLKSTIDAES